MILASFSRRSKLETYKKYYVKIDILNRDQANDILLRESIFKISLSLTEVLFTVIVKKIDNFIS